MLEVRDLYVYIDEKEIIKSVNLRIEKSEVHVLMGPNGSGKTTLLKAIAGFPLKIKGRIIFEGQDITNLKLNERVKIGIVMMHQNPPRINILTRTLIDNICKKFNTNFEDELGISHLLNRMLFKDFSGGEIKKLELLIIKMLKPKLALLDEPDSGIDIDSLKDVAKIINKLIDEGASLIIVTHTGKILEYIKRVDYVHIMINGRIIKTGNKDLIHEILEKGYGKN